MLGDCKYLGIIETASSTVSIESFEKVRNEIIKRVNKLCETKLNANNLFKAINEHAILVINYHIGVLKLEPADFKKFDDKDCHQRLFKVCEHELADVKQSAT